MPRQKSPLFLFSPLMAKSDGEISDLLLPSHEEGAARLFGLHLHVWNAGQPGIQEVDTRLPLHLRGQRVTVLWRERIPPQPPWLFFGPSAPSNQKRSRTSHPKRPTDSARLESEASAARDAQLVPGAQLGSARGGCGCGWNFIPLPPQSCLRVGKTREAEGYEQGLRRMPEIYSIASKRTTSHGHLPRDPFVSYLQYLGHPL